MLQLCLPKKNSKYVMQRIPCNMFNSGSQKSFFIPSKHVCKAQLNQHVYLMLAKKKITILWHIPIIKKNGEKYINYYNNVENSKFHVL